MCKVRVKICGITNHRDLKLAAKLGTDALGFVVGAPRSPRNLSLSQATDLMKSVPPFIASVAVTVFSSADDLVRIGSELNPDFLQVHGGETTRILELKTDRRDFQMIRAIDLDRAPTDEELHSISKFEAVMVDSSSEDGYGGTGRTQNLEQGKALRENLGNTPLILSGGLNPETVREAVRRVRPYAVDVATGVETQPGRKDPAKVKHFIEEAKRDY